MGTVTIPDCHKFLCPGLFVCMVPMYDHQSSFEMRLCVYTRHFYYGGKYDTTSSCTLGTHNSRHGLGMRLITVDMAWE